MSRLESQGYEVEVSELLTKLVHAGFLIPLMGRGPQTGDPGRRWRTRWPRPCSAVWVIPGKTLAGGRQQWPLLACVGLMKNPGLVPAFYISG